MQASIPQASFVEEVFAIENGNILQIEGDTAIISIRGLITQRPCWEQVFMGGVTTHLIHDSIVLALDDSRVKQIVLDVDSPGGEIAGVEELSNFIFAARKQKNIVAACNSQCCSAAYWIASAASQVFMAGKGAVAGSIGVVAIHENMSKALDNMGVKVTEITAGKYKRAASSYKDLDEFGTKTILEQVDYYYSLFISAVARNRGTTDDDVLKRMADGKIFIGEQAISAGLADGFLNFILPKGINMPMVGNGTGVRADEKDDRIKQLEQQNEELKKQIEEMKKEEPSDPEGEENDEKKAMEEKDAMDKEDEKKKAFSAGAKAERERIKAIDDIAQPGFEKITAKAKNEGWSAEKTAMEIIKAQKSQGVSLQGLQRESYAISGLTQANPEESERSSLAALIAGKGKK